MAKDVWTTTTTTTTPTIKSTTTTTSTSTSTTINNTVVDLDDFHAFHGMLCSPRTAWKCIQAFRGGAIFFLPSQFEESSVDDGHYVYTQSLNVMTYYLLVFFSLTGLSTLFHQTQTMDATEYYNTTTTTTTTTKDCRVLYQQEQQQQPQQKETPSQSESSRILWSTVQEPRIQFQPFLFDKILQQHSSIYPETSNVTSLKLKRRFEYQFSFPFFFMCCPMIHVIMLHIESSSSSSNNNDDNNHQQQLLHLVEIYHIHNSIFRIILQSLLYWIGKPIELLLGKQQPRRSHHPKKMK